MGSSIPFFIDSFLWEPGRTELDEILNRLNKMDNNSAMKDVMADSNMTSDSVDLILKAINDMQVKIMKEVDTKLVIFATTESLSDLEAEVKAINRRVTYNENTLKDKVQTIDQNSERIEANRKKLTRLQGDIDALRRNTASQSALSTH